MQGVSCSVLEFLVRFFSSASPRRTTTWAEPHCATRPQVSSLDISTKTGGLLGGSCPLPCFSLGQVGHGFDVEVCSLRGPRPSHVFKADITSRVRGLQMYSGSSLQDNASVRRSPLGVFSCFNRALKLPVLDSQGLRFNRASLRQTESNLHTGPRTHEFGRRIISQCFQTVCQQVLKKDLVTLRQ